MLNVVGKRGWYFLFSALILLPGLISLVMPPGWATWDSGLNPGIDFTSGSVLQVTFDKSVNELQIQQQMDALGHPETLIQKTGSNSAFIRTMQFREAQGEELSEREIVERHLEETLGLQRSKVDFESVSPIIAGETVRNAILAVAAASVFILGYIWYAFRLVPKPWRYGVSAILALIHDVVFVLGVFSILGRALNMEVNSLFIVGILIVARHSVNDTIVVFDRIRENVVRHPDRGLDSTVNFSIMETIGRSLNTSFTTLFVLLAMLLLGGPSIRELLLAVALGTVIGTYSSIFIASQFLVIWDRGELGRFLRMGRRSAAARASGLLSILSR